MPLYTVTTQAGVLDSPGKADLADKLSAFHAEYAAVPKNWVHIVFHEYPSGSGFTAGRPSATAATSRLMHILFSGYEPSAMECVPPNSSPPSPCATRCPNFSSDPRPPQYSQNSWGPTSIPSMPARCDCPDRLKSRFYDSLKLRLLGKRPAGRRTGHCGIGTLKIIKEQSKTASC